MKDFCAQGRQLELRVDDGHVIGKLLLLGPAFAERRNVQKSAWSSLLEMTTFLVCSHPLPGPSTKRLHSAVSAHLGDFAAAAAS